MSNNEPSRWSLTRRALLRRGGALGAAVTVPGLNALASAPNALASAQRAPGSLPHPTKAAGTVDPTMPFDHIVVVMMENHSFDNLLGLLPIAGQPRADGFTIADGKVRNQNPGGPGVGKVTAYPFPSTAQGTHVGQDWNATHEQINGGKMNGFAQYSGTTQPMGYYPPQVVPFSYSLATTFTVANRWFCSTPCQTYPNRRFLMAGTAYGDITTDVSTLEDPPPPNGTIFDQLAAHGISWRNYFTDLPQTAIIPSIIETYPTNLSPIVQFYADCAAGTLPQVSFVDPEFGVLSDIGLPLTGVPGVPSHIVTGLGGDEESPQDMYYGEAWAYLTVNAVMNSPAWPRTLLIYTYDEHGGYYDHVPPPKAIKPDNIPPNLTSTDVAGDYGLYGPRVPAVVVSPYSRPNAVTNVLHDHTSVLATIEHKWNLPALTYRDANATTVMDFLNVKEAAFLKPPTLDGPSLIGPSGPVPPSQD